jgi:hypothetical protein
MEMTAMEKVLHNNPVSLGLYAHATLTIRPCYERFISIIVIIVLVIRVDLCTRTALWTRSCQPSSSSAQLCKWSGPF